MFAGATEVDDRRKRNFPSFDNSSIELLQIFRKKERYSLPFQFTDDVVSDCDGDEERKEPIKQNRLL